MLRIRRISIPRWAQTDISKAVGLAGSDGLSMEGGNGTLPLKHRWPYATGSCLFEQPILPCALVKIKKEKDRKSQSNRERQHLQGTKMKRRPVPEGWPSLAATRVVCRPGGELMQGASTLSRQMFLHAGALLFFKCLFQAGSSALPCSNTFLHKQQIVLLLSFSGFGRNGNRLLHLSLQSLFSSAHVDSYSPWLPAVFFPVLPFASLGTILPLPLATDHCGSTFTLSHSALQVLVTRS